MLSDATWENDRTDAITNDVVLSTISRQTAQRCRMDHTSEQEVADYSSFYVDSLSTRAVRNIPRPGDMSG